MQQQVPIVFFIYRTYTIDILNAVLRVRVLVLLYLHSTVYRRVL